MGVPRAAMIVVSALLRAMRGMSSHSAIARPFNGITNSKAAYANITSVIH